MRRLCQEHSANTDTIITVDIHAQASRNTGCSTCAREEEEEEEEELLLLLPAANSGRCSNKTPTMVPSSLPIDPTS